MTRFVKFTDIYDKPIYVRVSSVNIIGSGADDNTTRINGNVYVKESTEQVKRMLSHD